MDKWQKFTDVIPNFENTSLQSDTLLEHMNVTKDVSDYLWYTLRYILHLLPNTTFSMYTTSYS